MAACDLICPDYPEDTTNATGAYWGQVPYVGFVEVDPATVGQYTGLTDKNGKRIFEGDILYSIYSKMNYPVIFGKYSYVNDYGDEELSCGWLNEDNGGYKSAIGNTEDWAVIVGNIHDNPELLEGEA